MMVFFFFGSVSAKVVVQTEGKKAKTATVTKAHATLVDYDILYQDGTMETATPAHLLRDSRVGYLLCYRLVKNEKRVTPPPPVFCLFLVVTK